MENQNDTKQLMKPTIRQVMKMYAVIAKREQAKSRIPADTTIEHVKHGAIMICEAAGIPMSKPFSDLTLEALENAVVELRKQDMTTETIVTYLYCLRGLVAKWSLSYYRNEGWDIQPPVLPYIRTQPTRYERPSVELLERVKNWYSHLEGKQWFAATMMLEFAMRNGDVLQLQDKNFISRKEKVGEKEVIAHYLSYVPHKTAFSSGRHVYWQIHDSIWEKFQSYGGLAGLDITDEVFVEINKQLRDMGFHGRKAAYELRKICIDHIYQNYGAEMAVAISGDDINTISHYYADISMPNTGAILVVNLL